MPTFLRFSAAKTNQPATGPEPPVIRDPKTGRRLADPFTLADDDVSDAELAL